MKGAVFVFLALILGAHSLDNGLGLTPQMGWNSWNHFWCGISEKLIQSTAQQIISLGLNLVGYKYINLDDCWQVDRNKTTNVIIPDPLFPSGIAALAEYMHRHELLFGVYSDAGYKTCAGRPASLGYETIDAQTYASWGVDYLKYDNCNTDGSIPEKRYPVMRDALNNSGRAIFFSMCEWGVDNPATWAMKMGNSWRTTGDISDNWDSMLSNIEQNDEWWSYAGPGGWNDPDMLEIGNGGLKHNEEIAHFSLWCLAKAPLLIGCDVTKISEESLAILTNTEAIAINQDPLGKQGHKVWASKEITGYVEVSTHAPNAHSTVKTARRGHKTKRMQAISAQEVWAGPLANGDVAVVLLNTGTADATIEAKWADIGLSGLATARDLWAHTNVGNFSDSYKAVVGAHSVQFLRFKPVVEQEEQEQEENGDVVNEESE